MFDIHAHVQDSAFAADRDEVVSRAFAVGVEKIITIGTDVVESRAAVACAERYEGVYASVGIHPHEIMHLARIPNTECQIPNQSCNDQINEWMNTLREIAKSSDKVVAIGECGLDYFVREEQGVEISGRTAQKAERPLVTNEELGVMQITVVPPEVRQLAETAVSDRPTISQKKKEIQKEGFIAHIELARELNLPLIIHCRPSVGTMDAYEELFLILKSKIINLQSIILHCYMGDTEVTEKFLTLSNVYFSFTGNITYSVKKVSVGTKDDIRETVKMIPIDRMFAETDCPYLAPMPHRGKRNEPSFVPLVVQKIAEIKGISAIEVMAALDVSANAIFAL